MAAYAAALARGASREDAVEEAEFCADEWRDDAVAPSSRDRFGGIEAAFRSDSDSDSDDSGGGGAPGGSSARLPKVPKKGAFGGVFGGSDVDEDEGSDADPDRAPTQVVFCSRTHSQLTQVVGELNATRFGGPEGSVDAVAVAGRKQLCVNADALARSGGNAARLNERCLELAEEGRKSKSKSATKGAKGTSGDEDARRGARAFSEDRAKLRKLEGGDEKTGSKPSDRPAGCPFLKGRRRAVDALAEELLSAPTDIEDLASLGARRRACPYYAAREALPRADLVFAPYASVLHAQTRRSLGLRLRGAVVVFDEAHNLAEAVHASHGAAITGEQVRSAGASLDAYVSRFKTQLNAGNLRNLKVLAALCKSLGRALEKPKEHSPGPHANPRLAPPTASVTRLNDFLFSVGADAVNFFQLASYLSGSNVAHKIAGYAEKVARDAAREEGAAAEAKTAAEAKKTSASSRGGDLRTAFEPPSNDSDRAEAWRRAWGDGGDPEDAAQLTAAQRALLGDGGFGGGRRGVGAEAPAPRVGAVHALASFVAALASADKDGRVLVEFPPSGGASGDRGASGGRIRFVLLDAASRFKKVVDEARAVVLVGGTLSPIPELARRLFPAARRAPFFREGSPRAPEARPGGSRPGGSDPGPPDGTNVSAPPPVAPPKPLRYLSCGHVVPRDALHPVALARGPTGRAFDFSHKARGNAETVDELARVLTNACAVTPGGVVAFFPSFAYADEAYARWVATGALANLSRTKRVFREPRSAADVEKTLRAFADAARGSISSGGGGGGAREDDPDPDPGGAEAAVSVSATGRPPPPSASSSASANTPAATAGALMLCVCGGKLSEGINFKDELGRLVVMVGLPFANPEEPELAARMAYLDAEDRGGLDTHTAGPAAAGRDAEFGMKKKSRGREYYEALCMRSVNQSVGRAIRHAGDYAAILFCDGRWARPGGVAAQLPRWIGEGLLVPESYGKAQAGLARFFAGRRRRDEEERARGGG